LISVAVMFIVDEPWLAALVFSTTYALFWINLRGAMK